MFPAQKTFNNSQPRPGLQVYRYGPNGSRPAEFGQTRGECSLTNAAGRVFWPQRVYKHATPDGVGNIGRKSSVS